MIIGLGELISKRYNKRRRNKIEIVDNRPSASSIEEAKAKVHEIIQNGKNKRMKNLFLTK